MPVGTVIRLGPVELDYCGFVWPFYLGRGLREVVVRQPSAKLTELQSLPYITDLAYTVAAEDGTATPVHETRTAQRVRVLEVRDIDGVTCMVRLGTCRHDLAARVCPLDLNLLWKDGYLSGTDLPTLTDAVEALAGAVPEVRQNVTTPPAEVGARFLPDGIITAGMTCLEALERWADHCNCDMACDDTGMLSFVPRGTALTAGVNVDAFNWVEGFEPSWRSRNRVLRGLPRTIRVMYPEKHALRVQPEDPTATAAPDALFVALRQVYRVGPQFLTLGDLLEHFGLSRSAITDNQIGLLRNTENFEGSALEPLGNFDTDAKALIAIIKRDWRSLMQVAFPDGIGRRGGWTDLQPGYFTQTTDKDGHTRYTDDLTARCVRAVYTAWLAKAEEQSTGGQASIEGAVVCRSYIKQVADPAPPDAPFVAQWESEPDQVLRIAPAADEGGAAHLWLGQMVGENGRDLAQELTIKRADAPVDDQGVAAGGFGGLRFPTVADVRFAPLRQWQLDVFLVGVRRLPNSAERWTAFDFDAFPDGELEVLEVEVGDELFALRDYTSALEAKPTLSDGFGQLLNRAELEKDAATRFAVVRERIAAELEGEGTAHGLAGFDIPLGSGVREVRIVADDVLVTTEVEVGNTDSEELRRSRKFQREARRVYVAGSRAAQGRREESEPPEVPIV